MRNSGVPSPEHQILNGNEPRLKHSSGPVDVCGYGVVGSCGAEKISVVILASAHARSVAPTAGGGGGGLGGSTLVTQVFSMKPWPANWKLRPVDCSVSITSEVPYANVRKVTWKQSLFRDGGG